ncbi:DUF6157 family protein [Paenibacillus sp. NPDC058071]|uniref:DUF6157 family protein n=1 Tax=Paenibacillus sp. NPDC058071 TaxID=3346326 RepID=UPI0036D851DC
MSLNYYNTFITIAPDSTALTGIVPPDKKNGLSKPSIEYELAVDRPYVYSMEQLLYEVHLLHKGFSDQEKAENGESIRAAFFGKSQACLRTSMLPKKYGWGIHFNKEGKLALYPVDSPEYAHYASGADGSVKVVPAMRSARAK